MFIPKLKGSGTPKFQRAMIFPKFSHSLFVLGILQRPKPQLLHVWWCGPSLPPPAAPRPPVPRLPSPRAELRRGLSGRRQGLSHFLLAHTLVSLKGTQLSCGKFIFIPQGWSQPLPPVWPSPPVLGSPRIPLMPLTEVSRGGQEAPSQKTGLDPGFMVVLGRPCCCSLTSVRVPSLSPGTRYHRRASTWPKWVRQKALTTGTGTGTSSNASYDALVIAIVGSPCNFFLFFFFLQCYAALWGLSSPIGTEPAPLTSEAWSLNHGSIREIPPCNSWHAFPLPQIINYLRAGPIFSFVHSQPRIELGIQMMVAWCSEAWRKEWGSVPLSPGRLIRAFRGMKKQAGERTRNRILTGRGQTVYTQYCLHRCLDTKLLIGIR